MFALHYYTIRVNRAGVAGAVARRGHLNRRTPAADLSRLLFIPLLARQRLRQIGKDVARIFQPDRNPDKFVVSGHQRRGIAETPSDFAQW